MLITSILIALFAGAAVGYAWEEIKELIRDLKHSRNFQQVIVSFQIFGRKVWVKITGKKNNKPVDIEEKQVEEDELPEDIKEKLRRNGSLVLTY